MLGAIEKLVYRVDFLEKRLKRAEDLLYHVIAGNNKSKGIINSSNGIKILLHIYSFE